MSEKNVLGLISSMVDDLPKAEKRIAQVILKTPEEIIYMTASELGKKSNTSAATVIRLCKRLEIHSFTELKVLISKERTSSDAINYSDFEPDESINEIMDKLLGNAYLALKDTVALMDEEKIEEAVRLIKNAPIIYVFGIGASHLVAEDISHKWSRIGKVCISSADPHRLIASMGLKQKNALFIGVSNSGEKNEVIKLMKFANENGYNTISITRFGQNQVANQADISLQHVRTNEAKIRSAATSSLHAQLLVVDIIFFAYSSKNYDNIFEYLVKSRKEIKKYNNEN